jgi:hypothetical protein
LGTTDLVGSTSLDKACLGKVKFEPGWTGETA